MAGRLPILTLSVFPAAGDAVATEASCRAELELADGNSRASQSSREWCGPYLEWEDPQNLGAPPFVLDNPTEEKDCHDFCAIIRGVIHGLSTSLSSLHSGALAY